MILFLVSILLALSISALCSLMEATLLSLTPSQVADIAHRQPRLGLIWQRFKSNVQPPIGAILLLNTAAHTIGASVAGAQFNRIFGDQWILIFSLIFTFVMLQFTEILPKTIGVRYNREVARLIARPLDMLVKVFDPILKVIHWINRPFEGRKTNPKGRTSSATIEEITALAGLARLSNQISPYQERIIYGASKLSQLPVEEIMIPVEQVSFLSTSQTLSDAIIAAHVEAHTRFPVCEERDHNQVVGYVNFKEMIYYMRTNPGDPSFRGIIRPVRFVPPSLTSADLLKGFVSEHVHMAIVRDSEGKTLGMVSFEDVVEELVGDLEDEFDRLPRMIHTLSGGTWMIGGGTTMSEVAQLLEGLPLEVTGTVSSWLLTRFNRAPNPGESYREGHYEFIVRRIRRGKIFEVAVYRKRE
ncbi:MAG: hemolysin family protein [Planctomycetota bacterium]|nr:hemolysin family protein [Planctomycetota bacterium]MDA1214411.1 hemolysin family protein [Planctomycetota bacterium]